MTPDDQARRCGDVHAIEQVLYRYASALDTMDWDLFDGCFAPDAVIEMSVAGRHPSPAHYREKAKAALASLDATHHVFSNPRISVDGNRAHAHCYYQAQHARNDLAPRALLMIGGWVETDLARFDGRWVIMRWRGTAVWMDGNPEVLGLDLTPGAVRRRGGEDPVLRPGPPAAPDREELTSRARGAGIDR